MSTYSVIDLRCPGCGEPSATNVKLCKYCGREVVITSFTSIYNMSAQDINNYVKSYKDVLKENPDETQINFSIGICYLKLRLYDKALDSFEKAIEDNFDYSDTYFYAAVCLLKGKKAFLTSKVNIERAEEFIDAALTVENRGIYNYFLAYIKYDFYKRKFLNVYPDYSEELNLAYQNNVTHEDIRILSDLLSVDLPKLFNS